MKRFILFATMLAFLAAGCQKTEIENEVLTPIGFSTNIGKQTKAIVQDQNYKADQPFGVFAYGHQGSAAATTIMNNIEIALDEDEDNDNDNDKWRATNSTSYYWPNDPNTTINFYAYSPYIQVGNSPEASAAANHQKLNGTLAHTEADGLSLTGYEHSNMYVDFMVATPVMGAKYTDPDGDANSTSTTNGVVPVVFGHKMTQVIFTVKTNAAYSGIDFEVQSITLNDIINKATYNYPADTWTPAATPNTANYTVFPAVQITDNPNGCPSLGSNPEPTAVTNENENVFTTQPVTMIPQALNNKSFTIVYTIEGTGVATETVTKKCDFTASPAWAVNQKITYNLTIGLNEITFTPSVEVWTSAEGSYDITPSSGNSSGN